MHGQVVEKKLQICNGDKTVIAGPSPWLLKRPWNVLSTRAAPETRPLGLCPGREVKVCEAILTSCRLVGVNVGEGRAGYTEYMG